MRTGLLQAFAMKWTFETHRWRRNVGGALSTLFSSLLILFYCTFLWVLFFLFVFGVGSTFEGFYKDYCTHGV